MKIHLKISSREPIIQIQRNFIFSIL